ncbi:MAG TPA: tetratricopeptide repeat protein [Terriglobia bacterium]|nr:tetratricopeptide repeat protein [Terriglobia bacterium]
MKKESRPPVSPAPARIDPSLTSNLITALVFLCVGFVAGYVFKSQTRPAGVDTQPNVTAAQNQSPASAPAPAGALPPGHPPVDTGPQVQAMEREIASRPQDPAPPLKLANFLYDQGNFEGAIRWYEKAVALDPRNVDASTDLGTCYFNVGRSDDALRQFRHSLSVQPGHQPTLFNIIVVNMEGKHDFKAAQKAYDALYRLNPQYPKLGELKKTLDDEARATTP